MNALKRGFFSRKLIVRALGEIPEEYDALHADMRARYRPQGREEALLVDKLASAYWRLARIGDAASEDLQLLLEQRPDDLIGALREAESLRPTETSLERSVVRWGARLEHLQTLRFGGRPALHLNDAYAVPAANDTPACGFAGADVRGEEETSPSGSLPAMQGRRDERASEESSPSLSGLVDNAKMPSGEPAASVAGEAAGEGPHPHAWGERRLYFSEQDYPEEFYEKYLDGFGQPRLLCWPRNQPFPKKFRSPRPYPGQPEPNWPPHAPQAKLWAARKALLDGPRPEQTSPSGSLPAMQGGSGEQEQQTSPLGPLL
jgi:hypothetical protein